MCLAVPGKIVRDRDDPLDAHGKVSFGGVVKDVSLAYLPEAQVDDYVIVHAGFALSQIDEAEAVADVRGAEPSSLTALGEDAESRDPSMKFVDEYRDPDAAEQLLGAIREAGHPAVDDHGGLRRPDARHPQLRHRRAAAAGDHAAARPRLPGVRDAARDDRPRGRARRRPDVIFTSFGDMLRVPGTDRDLLSVKAAGGDVRIVYSPLDALTIAAREPATSRSCFSPSASKPPRRATRWPCSRRSAPA